jgi:hypothetical protein
MAVNRLVIILAALALTGCASLDLSNRASRTLACDEVLLTSKWGKWLGVTTVLDARDAAPLLKDCKQ